MSSPKHIPGASEGAPARSSDAAELDTEIRPPGPSFLSAPPPGSPPQELGPERLEFLVRSAMHQDRTPGVLVAVCHPQRMHRFPRPLFDALREGGWDVRTVDTHPDRSKSVEQIRGALLEAHGTGQPLDLMVVSGDGTLDHHVLVAAFLAFYPGLVEARSGALDTSGVGPEDIATIAPHIRSAFLDPLPDGAGLDPNEQAVADIWILRSKLENLVRKGRPLDRILRKAARDARDPALRLAILAAALPHLVELRPHGFDLSRLAEASQEETWHGLYPFIRSITVYPAGTAADNAVFSGTPGWTFARFGGLLARFNWLGPIRRRWEKSVTRAFMAFFTQQSVVVPARISVMGFDGRWQGISSHAAGGPAAGRFFTADLTSKTSGLWGYLRRIPQVVVREGVLGSTKVRVISRHADGSLKSHSESQLSEGLYTNRTFIAGVGSVPTTGPTSFAGQSSLLVIPPILTFSGVIPKLSFRSLGAFSEGILKGVAARTLHALGLGTGKLAGGGRMALLLPENQVAIKEGEEIEIRYYTMDGRPRAVPVQVSGDPFQAWEMRIRASWAPIPLLGHTSSLIVSSTRSTLADLRLQQTYQLRTEYIGGAPYFLHHLGEDWSTQFQERTGLVRPPPFLPLPLGHAQRRLLEMWRDTGAGDFVDTTETGMRLGRRGRYAHNNDQSAHLVVFRQRRGGLLVRQLRMAANEGRVYENRTHYQAHGAAYIKREGQTLAWSEEGPPTVVQVENWFRDAEEFQQAAPTFFPVIGVSSSRPTLLDEPTFEDRD